MASFYKPFVLAYSGLSFDVVCRPHEVFWLLDDDTMQRVY
jgi:hypothetical protein